MNTDLSYLDDIRDALMAPQTFDSEAMKATVAEFNDSCRDANHRLRKVVGLLHGGFRTEAVQVAEQDPPLLELVGESEREIGQRNAARRNGAPLQVNPVLNDAF